MKYGLIAGGGRFPILSLEAARRQGHEVVAVAVKEEAAPEVEGLAARCYWISLGELSRLIRIFREEGVRQAVMAGRVQHRQIFSAVRPDWRLLKVLNALRRKNTNSLIGAVAQVLAEEGVELLDSTLFLQEDLAKPGANGGRELTREERADVEYGREIARALAAFDIGQTVAVARQACVAVEAMEGTDALIERAATLANGRPLTIVKSARPNQDMRFDVPTAGPTTIRKMERAKATALAVEAGRTLLLDRPELIAAAERAGVAVWGFE